MLLVIFNKIKPIYCFLKYKSTGFMMGSLIFKKLIMAKFYNRKLGMGIDEEAIQVHRRYGCLLKYDVDSLL